MAEALYRWNPGSERYIAPSGRFVSRAAVRASLDHVLDRQMGRAVALSDDLVAGKVSLPVWRAEMAQALKTGHLEGAAVAKGGWARLDEATLQFVGQRVRSELGYLQRFHDDIASGAVPLDGQIANRAAMYIEAGRGTHRQVERMMAIDRGQTEERNRLGGSRDPCSECPALSALGWVPIGTLPPPGARQCMSRCKCSLATRNRRSSV